jgi:hypothetical protein
MKEESMEPTKIKELLLTYLDEVISHESSKLVGKCLKRLEIIDDRETLKKELKELIYESSRELKDIFEAYSKGVEVSYFNFINIKE